MLRVLSWNVNGLRAVLKKNLPSFMREQQPDIIAFQETKATEAQVDLSKFDAFEGYHQYWCSSVLKKGYSGTLILSKTQPKSIRKGMNMDEHDQEGRVIAAEYENFILVNVYTPNSKPDLSRLEYRQVWDREFAKYLLQVRKECNQKPLLICGDFNVAHREIDLARPMANDGKHGFTREERAGFDHLLATTGVVDTYRYKLGDTVGYSYWSLANGSRKNNVGWRIDYFLANRELLPCIQSAFIMEHIEGSDHAPVGVEIDLSAALHRSAKP